MEGPEDSSGINPDDWEVEESGETATDTIAQTPTDSDSDWAPEGETQTEEPGDDPDTDKPDDSPDDNPDNPDSSDDPSSSDKNDNPDEPGDDPDDPGDRSLSIENLPEETESVFNSYLTERSGGLVESISDLSEVLEDLPAVQEIVKENQSLREQVENGLKPVYENEYAKELDEYMRTGGDPEFFHRMQGVDVDNLEPVEKIKLLHKWEHPDLTDSQIEAVINNKYHLNVEQDEENKDELEAYKAQMAMDASSAATKLKEHQKSYEAPKNETPSAEDIEQERLDRIEGWGEFADEFSTAIEDNVEVDLGGDQDPLKIELTDSDREFIKDKTQEIIEYSGLDNSPESQDKISEAVYNSFIIENHDRIVQEAYKKGLAEQEKRDLDQRQNPSSKKSDTRDGGRQEGQDKDDFILGVNKRVYN